VVSPAAVIAVRSSGRQAPAGAQTVAQTEATPLPRRRPPRHAEAETRPAARKPVGRHRLEVAAPASAARPEPTTQARPLNSGRVRRTILLRAGYMLYSIYLTQRRTPSQPLGARSTDDRDQVYRRPPDTPSELRGSRPSVDALWRPGQLLDARLSLSRSTSLPNGKMLDRTRASRSYGAHDGTAIRRSSSQGTHTRVEDRTHPSTGRPLIRSNRPRADPIELDLSVGLARDCALTYGSGGSTNGERLDTL